jgi:hypothetical protein
VKRYEIAQCLPVGPRWWPGPHAMRDAGWLSQRPRGQAVRVPPTLAAVGAGQITIEEGSQFAKILEMQAKVLAETNTEARLARIEEELAKRDAA